tara:strand:- start:448 stop:1248 length:801 start_codon:yes stop_codon:yes gene_type:complete
MKKNILVSILIPSFNSSETIERSLNSAINQTYKNIEILLSDNASTDNSKHIYSKKKFQKVKIFKQKKNIGGIRNYNYLISKSNGKYFCFLHADDLISNNYIENCLSKMELDRENSIVIGKMYHNKKLIKDNNKLNISNKFLRISNFCRYSYTDILINGLVKKSSSKKFNLNFISCETPYMFEIISNGKLQYTNDCYYIKNSPIRPIYKLYKWYIVKKSFKSRYGYFFNTLGIIFKKNIFINAIVIILIFALYNLPFLRIIFKKQKP